jgi:hypothetical protein
VTASFHVIFNVWQLQKCDGHLLVTDNSYFRQAIILALNFLQLYVWCILNAAKDFRKKKKNDITPNLETPQSPENQGKEVVADSGLYKTQFLNGKTFVRECWHDMKQLIGIVTLCRIL